MSVARIGRITSINVIPDADMIDHAEVELGEHGVWHGIVKKGDFKEDELVEVYLQDAKLPDEPRFAFMSRYKFVVRMIRLRGVPSECVISKLTVIGCEGDDIMEQVGVTKYDKPLPACLGGDALGNFPSFIPKTDEHNFQSVWRLVRELYDQPYYITEKADGTSTTVYYHDGHFGVCSRNLELKEDDRNAMWKIAREYDLENILSCLGYPVAIQFETVGPGIQKNPLGLAKIEPRVFDVYDIEYRKYEGMYGIMSMLDIVRMPMVSVIEFGQQFEYYTADDLQKRAEITYSNGKPGEGIVIRSLETRRVLNDRLSFKTINLSYANRRK